jgi:hypothetical protein
MIKEHDCVVLTSDLPSESLLSGDLGTVIHITCARCTLADVYSTQDSWPDQ